MYAIIETGGKQYRVAKGDKLSVEKLEVEPGNTITFDRVLLIGEGENAQVGNPIIAKAQVSGKVLDQIKDKKIDVYTYRKRTGYEKKKGHRQSLTTVEITEIKG